MSYDDLMINEVSRRTTDNPFADDFSLGELESRLEMSVLAVKVEAYYCCECVGQRDCPSQAWK
jgi:hypothetical protein